MYRLVSLSLVTALALILVLSVSAQNQQPEGESAAAEETVAAVESDQTTDGVADADAAADADAGEAEQETGKTVTDQWITWLVQGGRTMIFLGLLSILGLGCALERFAHMRIYRVVPAGLTARVIALWKQGQFDEIREECSRSNSMLARVVESMLEHRDTTDFQAVKVLTEDKASRELRLEHRKGAMLSIVATLAPLLGLFGTIVGLLGAFTTVAAVGEMGDPALLADDISKALITTVAGLAIAMPALFIYNVIRNRLELYAVLLEEEVSDLVNNLFVKKAS